MKLAKYFGSAISKDLLGFIFLNTVGHLLNPKLSFQQSHKSYKYMPCRPTKKSLARWLLQLYGLLDGYKISITNYIKVQRNQTQLFFYAVLTLCRNMVSLITNETCSHQIILNTIETTCPGFNHYQMKPVQNCGHAETRRMPKRSKIGPTIRTNV